MNILWWLLIGAWIALVATWILLIHILRANKRTRRLVGRVDKLRQNARYGK